MKSRNGYTLLFWSLIAIKCTAKPNKLQESTEPSQRGGAILGTVSNRTLRGASDAILSILLDEKGLDKLAQGADGNGRSQFDITGVHVGRAAGTVAWNWDELDVSGRNSLDVCTYWNATADDIVSVCYSVEEKGNNVNTHFEVYDCYGVYDDASQKCNGNPDISTRYGATCTDPARVEPLFENDADDDLKAECSIHILNPSDPTIVPVEDLTLINTCTKSSDSPSSNSNDCVFETSAPLDLLSTGADVITTADAGDRTTTGGDTELPDEDETPISTVATGGSHGDPHLKTWRGYTFDYHGACDLVLLHSKTLGKDGRGLNIHIRTEITGHWSYIKNAVVQIGDETLELASHGDYFLNGKKNVKIPSHFAGYPLKYTRGGVGSTRIQVQLGGTWDLGNRGFLVLREFKGWVSVAIMEGPEDLFADSIGLMGNYHSGQRLLRDGITTAFDHNSFGQEWQVRSDEPKLFRSIEGPQYPDNCVLPDDVPAQSVRMLRTRDVSFEEAKEACMAWDGRHHDIKACIHDVIATGDLEMAEAGAM